ncbi:hypothetical protein [Halosimplex pelagicum]|uniref:Uncharacterized protein n=1 Tax=Halosimplex pelagicum TaxID=869886 RepID=A0A7D5TAL6_9EURY|nr:hypothetical protein [Halosimplex pelagicum]QLH81429.1 hypothetical protein HZS54_07225 [Halosimplex pelagicum]
MGERSPQTGRTTAPEAEQRMAVAEGAGGTDVAVDVGVLPATAGRTEPDRLVTFAERLAADAADELAAATDATWRFFGEEPEPLSDGDPRRPSEFLDEAALRMVEGPYDLVVVVTDAPLLARNRRRVAGLASPLGRIAVVSTHRLRVSARGRARRSLDAPAVRYNGAAVLLHQVGHLLGAGHDADGGVMAPWEFDPERRSVPSFDADVRRHLERTASRVPEESVESRSVAELVGFHLTSAARNPRQLLGALATSRAPLLPLFLPKLSTAAVAPTLILVFSAETWDVGLNLDNATAGLFAVASVLAAAVYLVFSLNLNVPRERRAVVTEHVALLNVAILGILLAGMAGLFALVGGIMLVVEFFVFPPNLMTNWPSLEDPVVTTVDIVRIAGFIATIGVLTGALAGGLEDRTILRHLALFRPRP